jgi:hypothetical protein
LPSGSCCGSAGGVVESPQEIRESAHAGFGIFHYETTPLSEDIGTDAGEGQSREGGGDRGNVPNRATQTHASPCVDEESLDGTLKISSPGSDPILQWA